MNFPASHKNSRQTQTLLLLRPRDLASRRLCFISHPDIDRRHRRIHGSDHVAREAPAISLNGSNRLSKTGMYPGLGSHCKSVVTLLKVLKLWKCYFQRVNLLCSSLSHWRAMKFWSLSAPTILGIRKVMNACLRGVVDGFHTLTQRQYCRIIHRRLGESRCFKNTRLDLKTNNWSYILL